MSKNPLYTKIKNKSLLYEAWKVVRENGLSQGSSKETKENVKKFEQNFIKNLNDISNNLRKNQYEFSPSKGVTIKKPGEKSLRPIVISTIGDRVVKRAILDVLQSRKEVQKYIDVKTSFGCIKIPDQKISTRDAVLSSYRHVQDGASYFIRSDIKSFFCKIPKPTVLEVLKKNTTGR
ncbi:hypothetical protein EPN96_02975 [bacterium]|nr:MAG: hypothetical protein EPN96_02975 [bacterium]